MRKIESYSYFLRVIKRTDKAFEVGRVRGDVALAFGREKPETPGEYLALDLIAMEMVDRLMRFFENRKTAADFVRVYWPQWYVALARAEDAQENDFIFFVGGREAAPRWVKNWMVYGGHFKKIYRRLAEMPPDVRPTHLFYVDMWETAKAVRAAAKREGVGVSERFSYSLDDPRFEATMYEELRKHNDRILRERKAGKPRAAKATKLVAADVRALIAEARGLQ